MTPTIHELVNPQTWLSRAQALNESAGDKLARGLHREAGELLGYSVTCTGYAQELVLTDRYLATATAECDAADARQAHHALMRSARRRRDHATDTRQALLRELSQPAIRGLLGLSEEELVREVPGEEFKVYDEQLRTKDRK